MQKKVAVVVELLAECDLIWDLRISCALFLLLRLTLVTRVIWVILKVDTVVSPVANTLWKIFSVCTRVAKKDITKQCSDTIAYQWHCIEDNALTDETPVTMPLYAYRPES